MIIKKVVGFLDYIIIWGEKLQIKLGALMLLTIIVSILFGVTMRFVFNAPQIWPEEISGLLFVWVCFLGAGVAVARKQHIVVEIWANKFNQKWQQSIIYLLILMFLAIMIIGGFGLLARTGSHSHGALGITRNYYFLPLLLVSIYMFVFYVSEILKTLFNIGSPLIQENTEERL